MDDRREARIEEFAAALAAAAPLLVLTGAGISAGSGIPTYRDGDGRWLRSDPITHRQFVDSGRQRQRYWGRSALGWPAVSRARPGAAHRALATLETAGLLAGLVTQNVDRLHQGAGSRRVIDLHGRLDRVRCLACRRLTPRAALQQRLLALNPFLDRPLSGPRPDGDADLDEAEVDAVRVPHCEGCGGTLMPDVVFFGGRIPAARLRRGERALDAARGLLVVGSSLQVYSGYRYCRQAQARGQPLFLLNPGVTRADPLATARLAAPAETALPALLPRLVAAAPPREAAAP